LTPTSIPSSREFSEAAASTRSAQTTLGALQASDREQLDIAVAQRRTLVTFNVRDFVAEARVYAQEGRDHWGIIVSDQLQVGEVVRRLTKVLGRYSASDMRNRFVWLQTFA
jgi:hypothetical protein